VKRYSYTLRDGELSALHFGDMSEPVRLVFLHANGFNARSYRAILEPLGVHSVAGHSFGAVSGVLAAPKIKNYLSGYVGFDPVSVPFLFRLTSALPGGKAYMKKRVPIARNAGRRKSVFETPEAAFARWQGRGAFKGMADEIMRDYIAGGLFEHSDGSWHLCCNPKWEQTIFTAQWHNLFKAARFLPENSHFIYAGGRAPVSTKGTRAAVKRAGPQVSFDSELGHLFPFIQTDFSIQALRTALDKAVKA